METNAHPSSSPRHTELAGMTNTVLEALARGGWRVTELRNDADALEIGAHPLTAAIPFEAHAATIASMRAEADRLAADAATAEEILETRTRNAGRFTYDQHGNRVARLADKPRCETHPAYHADNCPGCGTAAQIR